MTYNSNGPSPSSLPPAFRPPSADPVCSWEDEETEDIPSYLAPSGGSTPNEMGLGLTSHIPPASSFTPSAGGAGHRYPFGPPLPSSGGGYPSLPPSSSGALRASNSTHVPDQLQSELTALMGDEGASSSMSGAKGGDSATLSTASSSGPRWGLGGGGSLLHQALNDYTHEFSVPTHPYESGPPFGAHRSPFSLSPLGAGGHGSEENGGASSSIFPHLSAAAAYPPGPPTCVTAEECGFDPALTILLAHLPEKVLFRDINEFFRQANLPYEVCVKLRIHPLAADRCCYVQFHDAESMHQMLQLDNAPICGEPVRVLPARVIGSALNRPTPAFGEPFRDGPLPLRASSASPEVHGPFGSSGATFHDPFMTGGRPPMGPSNGSGGPYGGGPSFLSGHLGTPFSGPSSGPFGYSSYFDGPGLSFMGASHPPDDARNSFYSDFGPSSSSSSSVHDSSNPPRF